MARIDGGGGLPSWLNFDPNTQTFTGTPGNASVGTIVIRVFASDGVPHLASTTFNLTVQNVNDAPSIRDVGRTFPFSDKIVVGQGAFQFATNDVDSSTLEAVLVSGPTSGDLTLQSDGSFVYIPEPEFFGKVTFTWRASDGDLLSDVATVTIVIAPPIATDTPDNSDGDSEGEPEDSDDVDSSETNDTTDEFQGGAKNGSTNAPNLGFQISSGVNDFLLTSLATPASEDDGVLILEFEADETIRRRALMASIESSLADSSNTENGDRVNSRAESDFETDNLRVSVFRQLELEQDVLAVLNEQQQNIDALLANDQMTIGTMGVATSGLTVGFVAWALRGGIFISGFLTQLPMWKLVDPLVIMQAASGQSDETIEELMEQERQALDHQSKDALQ